MNLIAYGGPDTKYTKGNTRDSLILSVNVEFIDGIQLNVYITKDNVLTSLGPETFNKTGLTKETLENTNYEDLKKYNIGNKVKGQTIIDLREAFSIYNNSNKLLLLNVAGTDQKNALIVRKLKELTEIYPNVILYIETNNEDISDFLFASNIKAKLGQLVTTNNINNIYRAYDFYTFNANDLLVNVINGLYVNNKEIFVSEVNESTDLTRIFQTFPDKADDFYLISRRVATINASYILNIKK